MQVDLSYEIWKKNKKVLTFGEIEHLIQLLQKQKPQFTKISYIGSEHKRQFYQENVKIQGAVILLRVFDEEKKINKSLKVYFIDHFPCSQFVKEIQCLFQSCKTLIRRDIILQIYDVYYLQFHSKCNVYFIVEQEDVQTNLEEIPYIFRKNESNLIQIMEAAIKYCSDRTNIKLKLKSRKMAFPIEFLKFFYLMNEDYDDSNSNQATIKLNVLATELFINPQEDSYSFCGESSISTVSDLDFTQNKVEEISSQLSKLLISIKKLETIKSEDFIDAIKSYGDTLLRFHDIELFDIIVQHPKYDDFELIEYEEDYFILGTKISGQHYYLKLEKFLSLKEVEQQSKNYELYYSIEDNMFIPISNAEIIVLENNTYYMLIEEKAMPNMLKLLNEKEKQCRQNFEISMKEKEDKNKLITSYHSMEYLIETSSDSKIHQLRILQIIVQLIKFVKNLHQHEIYHGRIKTPNIIVHIPIQFSTKPPDIYISNPLFIRSKLEQRSYKREVDDDTEDVSCIIYNLLHSIYSNVIDIKALKLFKKGLSSYFNTLIRQYYKGKNKMMENENQKIFFYIKKLENFFNLFQTVYRDNLEEKHIKINKKWLISVNKYQERMRQLGYYDFSEEEQWEDSEYDDEFYTDSSDSYYGMFKSKLDQCHSPSVFELDIEKVKYDFEDHVDSRSCDIIKGMSKNTNLKSLYIKGYKFQRIFSIFHVLSKNKQEHHSRIYLENLLKNCTNLSKLKLEITVDDSDGFDVNIIKDMKDLQHIKLRFWSYLSSRFGNTEDGIKPLQKQFQDFLEIFEMNRNFKQIDIHPFNILISSFQNISFTWYFTKYQQLYGQLQSKIILDQPEENDQQLYELESNQTKQNSVKIEYYLNNPQIVQKIQTRKEEIEQLNKTINSYFQLFHEQKNISDESKKTFLEKLHKFLNEHQYLSFLSYRVYENNKQLLVLEFQNILDEEIGAFVLKLQFIGIIELQIVSSKCRSQVRFGCFQYHHNQNFKLEMIEQWMQCEYETKIKEKLYASKENQSQQNIIQNQMDYIQMNTDLEQNNLSIQQSSIQLNNSSQKNSNQMMLGSQMLGSYQMKQMNSQYSEQSYNNTYISSNSCKHLDSILYQINMFKNQSNLTKLTIYFDYCENVTKNLYQTRDFFKFSLFNYKSLIEINIKMYFFDDNNLIKKSFFSNLRRHFEEAKSLVRLNIDTNETKKKQIKRQFIKLKRIVCVGFYRRK